MTSWSDSLQFVSDKITTTRQTGGLHLAYKASSSS